MNLFLGIKVLRKAKLNFCLYPHLDLTKVDSFKVVVEGCLMEEVDPKPTSYFEASLNIEFSFKDQMLEEPNVEVEKVLPGEKIIDPPMRPRNLFMF